MNSKSLPLSKLFSRLMVVVAIGFAIYLLLQDNTLTELAKIRLNLLPLFFSFFISYLGVFFGAIPVWRQILQKHGIEQSYWEDAQIYCYSALGSVLPGRIWTIAGRTSFYQQKKFDGVVITASSILENTIIGIAAFLIYATATIIQPRISLWSNHPEIGILIIVGCLPLIHPAIFQRILTAMLRWMKKDIPPSNSYRIINLIQWLIFEIFVTCVGGLSIYALLESMQPTTTELVLPVIAAWAAGVAVGNLFFWLPGTPIFRDGAMLIALSPFISTARALIFVAFVRLWAIVSLLLLAGLVYLITNCQKKLSKSA